MAHAAPKLTSPTVLDAKLAPPEIAAALRRWAGAEDAARLKLSVYEGLKGQPEASAALVSYLDASRWADVCWATVEAAVPFDPSISYRVGPYVVYVTPVSKRGLTHRWRRVS